MDKRKIIERRLKLLKLIKKQQNCELTYKHGNQHLSVTVPSSDLEDRENFIKSRSLRDKIIVKKSINKSIEKYLNSSEREKNIEENVCNFAMDIVLLWHMKDYRVSLSDKV